LFIFWFLNSAALCFLNETHEAQALMSGGVPSFLEAIFNFGGNQTLESDNLVAQFTRASKKIAFYGDDTWLKTFPGHFFRYEGVTSFFVAVCNVITFQIDETQSRKKEKPARRGKDEGN
jgi:ethanolaminephosphotransferase